MRPKLFLALATLAGAFSAGPARAQSGGFSNAGKSGLVILELPLGIRTSGRAGARVLETGGADALFGNAAGLVAADGAPATQASASTTRWFADTRVHTAAAAARAGRVGTFGISVAYLDYGEMPGAQNAGAGGSTGNYVVTEPFSARSMAVGLSYARRMTDRFAFGVTARYAEETIHTYSANAVTFDVGMTYATGLGSLRIGGLVQNFGQEARYLGNTFKVPTTFRLATAYDLTPAASRYGRLTAIAEAMHPNNGPEEIHAAFEYAPVAALALRGGYGFGQDEGGATFGGSLDVRGRLAVDAFYAAYGRLGSTLGVGVRAGF